MTTNPITRRLRTAGAVAVLAVALAACGSSSSGAASGSTAAAGATTVAATVAAPKVAGAWARTSAASQTMGAAYMMIENPGTAEDALVGVSVAATVAAKAEMHETVADTAMGASTTAMMTETTAMGSATTAAGDMGGAMKMQPVAKIAVPAKGSVELKPGGFHIMLIDLVKPLVKGDKFDLTLTFTSGAKTVVPVEVRDEA